MLVGILILKLILNLNTLLVPFVAAAAVDVADVEELLWILLLVLLHHVGHEHGVAAVNIARIKIIIARLRLGLRPRRRRRRALELDAALHRGLLVVSVRAVPVAVDEMVRIRMAAVNGRDAAEIVIAAAAAATAAAWIGQRRRRTRVRAAPVVAMAAAAQTLQRSLRHVVAEAAAEALMRMIHGRAVAPEAGMGLLRLAVEGVGAVIARTVGEVFDVVDLAVAVAVAAAPAAAPAVVDVDHDDIIFYFCIFYCIF